MAYLRVSTDKQADHGVSLEAQRAKVEAYASLYDLDLVAVEVDAGASAKTLARRPALDRALGMLKSGKADALLVVKLDRLTRSVRDLSDLVDTYFRDGRYALISVGEQVNTNTANGRMFLNLMTVISSWERETCAERTSAALQHLKSQGKRVSGRIPYGYALADDGETLIAVEDERVNIRAARHLRTQGLSYAAIAETLASRGQVARSGRPFVATQVQRMIESPAL